MNQIDTEIKYIPFKGKVLVYKFKYAFKNMPYLVADKYGNFFVLDHCKNKRTSNFKQLNSKNGYIYYQGIKYYLSRLRNIVIKQENFFKIQNEIT